MAQHTETQSYADSKDGYVLVFLVILVIGAFVGAFALQSAAREPCRTTYYVYCGDGSAPAGGEHAAAAPAAEH